MTLVAAAPALTRLRPPCGVAAFTVVFGLLIAWTAPAVAQSDEEILAAAREVLADGDIQSELPDAAREPRAAAREGPTFDPSGPSIEPTIDALQSGGEIASLLIWVIVIATALVLALSAFNAVSTRLRRGPPAQAEVSAGRIADGAPQAAAPSDPLGLADRLAREGRYEAAVHLLLLTCLEALRRRADPAPAASWTSWEIVRRLTLPGDAAAALSRIVALSESSHFGGRPASEGDFRSCRANFESFAAAIGSMPGGMS